MPQAYYVKPTNQGLAAMAASINGAAVVIADFVVGDGAQSADASTFDPAQTALKRQVAGPFSISGTSTPAGQPSQRIVKTALPQSSGGYTVTEYGLRDTAGKILFIARVASTYKPGTSEGEPTEIVRDLYIQLSAGANVTVQVNPAALATQQQVAEAVAGHEAKPAPHTGHSKTAANAAYHTVMCANTRDSAPVPQDHSVGSYWDWRAVGALGLADGAAAYANVNTFRGYGIGSDFTGGPAHQLAFSDQGRLWHRSGSAATWGPWTAVAKTSDLCGTIVRTLVPKPPPSALPLTGGLFSRSIYAGLFAHLTLTGTATFSGGSSTVTGISLPGLPIAECLWVGCPIESPNLPVGTTITSVMSANAVTVSNAATAGGSAAVRLLPYGAGNGSTTFMLPNAAGQFERAYDPQGVLDNTTVRVNTTANVKALTLPPAVVATLYVGMSVTVAGMSGATTVARILDASTVDLQVAPTTTQQQVVVVFAGRRWGSVEASDLGAHSHLLFADDGSGRPGLDLPTGTNKFAKHDGSSGSSDSEYTINGSAIPPTLGQSSNHGGTETRPTNRSVFYWIYF